MNKVNKHRETLLHVASWRGYESIVRLLLENGADMNRVDDCGWTPLHGTVQRPHESVIRLLVDLCDDVNKVDDGGVYSVISGSMA